MTSEEYKAAALWKSFEQTSAEGYPVPAEADRFYFFNPFSVKILKKGTGADLRVLL